MKKTMGKKIVTSFLKGMMLTLLVLGVLTVPLGNEKLVLADEEPVASVQATETAEPVAEVKASETTEPVAEVQVTETAEPVAEVQVTEAAEPVAEVQETETTQPVAEVQASETTQPVTEVQASEAASTEAYTETARLAQKATNPVQDPGFEYFQTRDPYNQQDVFYNSDNPYWQADRGSMVTNIPWGTEAAPGLGVRTLNLRNSYLLNSYGEVHQNLSLVPGQTYTFTFFGNSQRPSMPLVVKAGGQTIFSQTLYKNSGNYNLTTSPYTVPAGQTTTRLEFRTTHPDSSDGQGMGMWLDNVSATSTTTAKGPHTITEKYVDGNGQSIAANTSQSVGNGATYTKNAPTISGYTYQGYQVDGGTLKTGNPKIANVTGSHTVTMKYKKNATSLHVITETYVDENEQPIPGKEATVSLVADGGDYRKTPPKIAGYTYDSFKIDNKSYRSGNPYWKDVHENHSVKMKYKKNAPTEHVITETYVDENGQPIAGQANTSQSVANGATYSKTPPTITGYEYVGYQIDGGSIVTGNPTIPNVTGAHTVTMKYESIDYLIHSNLETGTTNPIYDIDRTTTDHYTSQLVIGTTAAEFLSNVHAKTSDTIRIVKADGIPGTGYQQSRDRHEGSEYSRWKCCR